MQKRATLTDWLKEAANPFGAAPRFTVPGSTARTRAYESARPVLENIPQPKFRGSVSTALPDKVQEVAKKIVSGGSTSSRIPSGKNIGRLDPMKATGLVIDSARSAEMRAPGVVQALGREASREARNRVLRNVGLGAAGLGLAGATAVTGAGILGLGGYGAYRTGRAIHRRLTGAPRQQHQQQQGRVVQASVLEYSQLFDHVLRGGLGKEAQADLHTICLDVDSYLDIHEKMAYTSPSSAYDGSPGVPDEESHESSRKRRLAELLKKREHSGTATGSASPNPPKGA